MSDPDPQQCETPEDERDPAYDSTQEYTYVRDCAL